MKKLLLSFLLLIPFSALADTITLEWDDNPPEDAVTSYNVYISSVAGVYSTTPKGTSTVSTFTFGETHVGKYFAVVTAKNAISESTFSNEVTFEVKQKGPTPPKHLSVFGQIVAFLAHLLHGKA